ncbi:hypothetical protein B0H16DRAFT_1690035 [Mycena metata]|uniref:Uncharacterized protein n=1 Tax=Mycena metata TaxID=1033252 RepID=A0AAD7J3H7_9AGAR|nr:hypothetical protein B0H16DRAFT_1690035 [Mycena metata]
MVLTWYRAFKASYLRCHLQNTKVEGGWGVDILVAWGVLVVQREAAKDAKSNNGPDNNSNDAINQLGPHPSFDHILVPPSHHHPALASLELAPGTGSYESIRVGEDHDYTAAAEPAPHLPNTCLSGNSSSVQ